MIVASQLKISLYSFLLIILGMLSIVSCNSKVKTEIVNKIEDTYFRFGNGTLGQGSDLPLYNTSGTTYMTLMGAAFVLLAADHFEVEAREIDVLSVGDKEAEVAYMLYAKLNENESEVLVKMKLKKIGGDWKLDGNSFIPMSSLGQLIKIEQD